MQQGFETVQKHLNAEANDRWQQPEHIFKNIRGEFVVIK
jgi:hypothetical protein